MIGLRTICHLGANLDPETLQVSIMEIDDFEEENDDSSAPED